MKHAKDFFGVLFSVLIAVFLVGIGVYAASTIGDDITIGDDLVVNGLASVSETLRVPTLYGNTDSGLYLRIGDQALTSHSLAAQDDLLVTGKLEVDGTAFFDGVVSLSDSAILRVAVIAGHKDLGLHLQLGAAASSTHDLDAASDVIVAGELEVDGAVYFDAAASVAADFSVDGIASISGNAFFAGTSTSFINGGDVKIGDGATNRLGADTENLYVEGVVEVDGAAYFDAAASVGADLSVASAFSVTGLSTLSRASISDSLTIDTVWIHSGTTSVTGTCNIGDIYFMSGTASAGKIISVCGNTDVWTWLGSAWQYY